MDCLYIMIDKEMPSFPGVILTTTLCGHSITEPSSKCSCMSRVDDDVNLSIINWISLSNGQDVQGTCLEACKC